MKSSLVGIPLVIWRQWSTLVVLCLVVLGSDLIPRQARAENWNRYNGWEITSFELTGLPKGIQGDFKSQLALHGKKTLFGTKRPVFKTKLLAEDLARIRLHLARIGYPKAETNPVMEAVLESRQLSLRIDIDVGQIIRVGKLELNGWPDRVDMPDTSKAGVVHSGQVFRDDIIETAIEFLETRLMDSGFESASVTPNLVGIDDFQIELHFDVEAGDYSLVESVVVVGCSDDLVSVALRVMDLEPGKEYSQEKMRRSALDLRGTQLFGMVELETENISPGHLLARATLENARMRSWYAGVGTWSDNPWMVRSGWSHNNLFKNGVGFRTDGVIGAHEVSLGADVFWWGWLTPRSLTSFGFMGEIEKELSYESEEARVELIQAFRPNIHDMWKIGISVSHVTVETFTPDPDEAPDAQGPLLEIWSDWKWDRTDNPINPSRGYYFKTSFTFAPPEVISESPYIQLQMDGVRYQPLGAGLILAGRLRLGGSESLGSADDLLANRRFYAGGYNTMRGYERRHLGPVDGLNEPRGGKFVALAGLELRYPLFWMLKGAIFYDSGQVWRDYNDIGPGTMSGALGMAVDLITPIGPLRLNYAVNVANRQIDRPRDMWTFGIGYPW